MNEMPVSPTGPSDTLKGVIPIDAVEVPADVKLLGAAARARVRAWIKCPYCGPETEGRFDVGCLNDGAGVVVLCARHGNVVLTLDTRPSVRNGFGPRRRRP